MALNTICYSKCGADPAYSWNNTIISSQVKEMEGVLRKRHPNSLPVLMWAASNAQSPQKPTPASVSHLESRINKLEVELESKDEEGKRTIRALQQKHNTVKVLYFVCVAKLRLCITIM